MSEDTPEAIEAPEVAAETTQAADDKVVPLNTFKKAERELKAMQKQLAEYEAAAKEKAEAEMTEVERYKAAAEEAAAEKNALQHQIVISGRQNEALKSAQAAGFADADVALRFIDLEATENEDIPAAVQNVLEQYPYLAAAQAEHAGPGRVGSAGTVATPSVGSGSVTVEEQASASFLRGLLGG